MKLLVLFIALLTVSCSHLRSQSSEGNASCCLLTFSVDEKYLALQSLKGNPDWGKEPTTEGQEIERFQKVAWEKFEEEYKIYMYFKSMDPAIIKSSKIKFLDKFSSKLVSLPEFKPLLDRTKKFSRWAKSEWENNFEKTKDIMEDITGLDFNKQLHIYITHNRLWNGRGLLNNSIGWGHSEDWDNYAITYFWHEMLHFYLPRRGITHALIELATDNELRVRLNGGKYPPFEGHTDSSMVKWRKKILPKWRKYLKRRNRSIVEFDKEINFKK